MCMIVRSVTSNITETCKLVNLSGSQDSGSQDSGSQDSGTVNLSGSQDSETRSCTLYCPQVVLTRLDFCHHACMIDEGAIALGTGRESYNTGR